MSDIKTVLTHDEINDIICSKRKLGASLEDICRAIERAVLAAATPGQVEADAEFEILQDDHPVASSFGPRARAAREALHYAVQYAQDGKLTIVEVTRKAITIDALKSASASEQKGDV
jgi:hypothetical protein